MFLDEFGNIVQQNGDGGDTAQRTGFVECVLKFREMLAIDNSKFLNGTKWRFSNAWPTLFDKHYKLIRSNRGGDSEPRWNDPKDTSRDQTEPMIMAFGLNNMIEQVHLVRPHGFLILKYQNGDLASPANMAIVDRALGMKAFLLGDLWMSLAVSLRIRQAKGNIDDVGDDLNLFLSLVFSYLIKPSKISISNLKKYLLKRPSNLGSQFYNETDHVMGALMWYFRKESGGNPDIAELCRDLILSLRMMLGCEVS